jgi:S-formylglutathione hydrolase FrmB
MALCTLRWFSGKIQKSVETQVILPDGGGPGPFPVFYLLHGLSDDSSTWLRRTRIEAYVAGLPLIVVMPDGFRSFYVNNREGHPFGDYIALELPAMIERTFHARTDRGGRCVGGLSMGGYGALRTALAHPDRYASATSHSGALCHGGPLMHPPEKETVLYAGEMGRIFGPDPTGTDADLLHLARTAHAAGHLPKLRIDCGTDDFLFDCNQHFHRELAAANVPHEYETFPGAHTWDYWDLHVRDALAFHAKVLGIVKA